MMYVVHVVMMYVIRIAVHKIAAVQVVVEDLKDLKGLVVHKVKQDRRDLVGYKAKQDQQALAVHKV